MHLTAFQSDEGDCLLLETKTKSHRMLIDGGMRASYRNHVAPALAKLRQANQPLDIVYVSHIDQDHIAGILEMLDNEVAWRVYDFRGGKKPTVPRPPEIKKIFHNSFHDQVGKNAGAIESLLAATASILSGHNHPDIASTEERRQELASSIPEALKVSRRIRPGQLNIPLNPDFDGKLMYVTEGDSNIQLGSITLKIIGPFKSDLEKLKKEWDKWLDTNKEKVKKINREARQDEKFIGNSEINLLLGPLLSAANFLAEQEFSLAKQLGNRSRVTEPNLASLMFLAEEDGQRLLLTGDGHSDDILAGLEHHQALTDDKIHVDVLKVQHHGSEHNIDADFCDAVTADRYIFCGNGEHENPDLTVINTIFERRMKSDSKSFEFFFNSSSTQSTDESGRTHMKEVEKLVKRLASKSQSRLSNTFIKASHIKVI